MKNGKTKSEQVMLVWFTCSLSNDHPTHTCHPTYRIFPTYICTFRSS